MNPFTLGRQLGLQAATWNPLDPPHTHAEACQHLDALRAEALTTATGWLDSLENRVPPEARRDPSTLQTIRDEVRALLDVVDAIDAMRHPHPAHRPQG